MTKTIYRFKTEDEFFKEFGRGWRDTIPVRKENVIILKKLLTQCLWYDTV